MRYQSAHGLKTDLIECQRRLLATVSSTVDDSVEVSMPFSQVRYSAQLDLFLAHPLF